MLNKQFSTELTRDRVSGSQSNIIIIDNSFDYDGDSDSDTEQTKTIKVR
jgi:hypothetical protein